MSHQTDALMGLGSLGIVGNDPDYITQLVSDVRRFAEVLLSLKEAFKPTGERRGDVVEECVSEVVKERLAELLRVLRCVISKHQALNSEEILSAAGALITKVKGLNLKEVNKETQNGVFREIYSSIDTLAFTFGNVVSDFLMGDVESGSGVELSQSRRSRSFENLCGDSGEHRELADSELSPVQKVDQTLQQNDSGVESALLYAKAWSKYAKDILSWVEKRLGLDMECAKGFAKMAESAKAVAAQQDYMPFRGVYVSTFENELDYSHSLLQTATSLQTNKFIQPLVLRKNELDKLRKELKEQWQREQKKMSEAEGAVCKARLLQTQRREEYEKARGSQGRTGDEQTHTGGRTQERKRKMEEEALQKAEEAQEHYRVCVTDAEAKKVHLTKTKSEILSQLREHIFQCDLTLKAVTVNWFQLLYNQLVSVPVQYQALCDQVKQYEPGQCYSEFVHSLPKERVWLEALSHEHAGPSRTGMPFHKRSLSSTHSSQGNLSQLSADEVNSPVHKRFSKMDEAPSSSSTADIHALKGGMCSDSESAGGSSESRSVDSPTASPGDFKRRLPRTPSTGTMSSADDLDEREPPSPSDNGLGEMVTEMTNSPGPFRNAQMSKAAHTHKLRKLRAPSKCRECDSLVVFHGAECEECSLACHKKCLETLAIQCGHKKLQGKLHLFGIDFSQAAKNSTDGIPFIIRKCTSEIESRALNIKGIYRLNGAKSRVEKLCQAFENGKDLVELSDLYPHDISNVLKLYLRQLPEPLILYRYYNEIIGLAKEAQSIIAEDTHSPGLSIELNRVILKIRDLLRHLPPAHYRTLHFLITHLHRVSEHAEENKMDTRNLGIIFGPTLIKPRQLDSDVSLSSLVDYPYQALMVELLILHHLKIFDIQLSPAPSTNPPLTRCSQSLLDIKESSKSHKRYSSVLPSSHPAPEVKEVHLSRGHEGKEDTADDSTDGVNGVGSSLAVSRISTNVNVPVKLRPPRTHYLSRPVSLPVDRLLNGRNVHNVAERENLGGAIVERPEAEKAESRPYRGPFVHTHTLRRTWDKQYRHYDVTPRTAMIVANLPPSGAVGGAKMETTKTDAAKPDRSKTVTAEAQSGVSSLNSPYTATVRSLRTVRRDSSTSDKDVPIAFRAPRMLQPPPGTFYRPPHVHVRTPDTEKNANVSPTTTVTTLSVTIAAPLATLNVCPASSALSVTPSTGSDTCNKEEVQSGSEDVKENNLHRETRFL
ncbi:rho GTPase-activating protein 29-like isoform X1 [Hemibagrus wyckioides]|uniref:rho GTPase-activating protein 29-like isoform X1 n=2 Tax=Hemibagrus wyckioides TaxID=337641 RepID=UPI00266C7A06|nr:rho GTPase-activating protein 29-like isoform X1 [Hemibagrus wyckioides]